MEEEQFFPRHWHKRGLIYDEINILYDSVYAASLRLQLQNLKLANEALEARTATLTALNKQQSVPPAPLLQQQWTFSRAYKILGTIKHIVMTISFLILIYQHF